MKRFKTVFPAIAAAVVVAGVAITPAHAQKSDPNNTIYLETKSGRVTIQLLPNLAPKHVAQIKTLTKQGFYDGIVFHRVIPGFMAQGGGFSEDMVQKSTFEAIKNEASAALPNKRGTLAMARTNVVDSATSQFFINFVDNDFLNHTDNTPRGFGYAVFAEVIEGMEIVDSMATVETTNKRGHQNVPVEPIVMTRVTRQK
jgi:cyclophilin family peptidyl-prolyl cis-trans isomerase